jgi:CPA1 family monovalent cation:H+ antiporter
MEGPDLIAIVLVLAAFIGCINHLWIRLPPAIGMLAGSLLLSLMVVLSEQALHLHTMSWFRATLDSANLSHVFLDGTLALLLFAGSLNVDLTELQQRRFMILLLATAGVIVSTVVFAAGMWAISRLIGAALPLAWCFVLGAILAPTDAVVVETLLRQVKLPPGLRAAIVGESLFNDGAGVVLFVFALRVTQGETISIGHGQILAALAREIVGGAAIGLVSGWLTAQLLRPINDEALRLVISLALVLGCYRLATLSDLSGPIAVVSAGLCLARLSPQLLAPQSRSGLFGFWLLLDQLLNTMLFLLIGIQTLDLTVEPVQLVQAAFGIALAIGARMVSGALPWGLTRGSLRDKARGIAVLTWAGLRGGISVALALTLPDSPWRAQLLVTSYAVVLFTIVVQGLTLAPFLRALYGRTEPD